MPHDQLVFPIPMKSAYANPDWSAQEFGAPRAGRTHAGIDLECAIGTNCKAPEAGTFYRSHSTLGGNTGRLEADFLWPDGRRVVFRFVHLNDFVVANGARVTKGQLIAHTGNTGTATSGPHLHYETHLGGMPTNPRGIHKELGATPLPHPPAPPPKPAPPTLTQVRKFWALEDDCKYGEFIEKNLDGLVYLLRVTGMDSEKAMAWALDNKIRQLLGKPYNNAWD